MLETLRNAFKIKDIRNRIIFTFLMLVVIRIGSQLPIPGVTMNCFQTGLQVRPQMEWDFLMQLPVDHSITCQSLH